MKSPFPRKRLRRAGAALAASLLASQPLRSETPRHVVLIHGIWDTFKTMQKMERVLRASGFDPLVITLTPNGGQRPLDDLGKQVHLQIRKRIPEGAPFSIIGFSMGGLVARSYLRQFGDPARIETFISIASPHRGTWLAWLDGNPGVRDMRPGSQFLSAIDADAPRFSKTRWVTIRTPLDLIILPSTSSNLSWAKNHSVPVLAHPLLVLDDRELYFIGRTLEADSVNTKSARSLQASPHGESPRPQSPGTRPRR